MVLKANEVTRDAVLLGAILAFLFSVLWSGAHSEFAFSNRPGHVYDNYYIAKTARNISIGKGWGLWNGEEFVPFEREISTGPTVFLPVALALKLVNDPDTARFIAVIFLNLLLTAVLFWKLRSFFPREIYIAAWLVMPFLFMGCMRSQWYLMLGEVSAILLVILSGVCIVEKSKLSNKLIVLSGFLSGVAMMSKLLALLSAAWVAVFLFLLAVTRHGWGDGFKKLTLWTAGFCVFPGAIALWHLVVFDGSLRSFFEYTVDYLGFYVRLGANASYCEDYLACFNQHFFVAKSAWKFGQAVHSPIFAAATLFVPIIGFCIALKKEKSGVDYFLIMLAGICFMQLLYFFEVGGRRWPRYYFMGAVSALIFLCLCMLEYFNKLIRLPIIKNLIFIIILSGAIYQSIPLYREQKVASYQLYTREAADYINSEDKINEVVWWGVGAQPFPIISYYLSADKRWLSKKGLARNYLEVYPKSENILEGADLFWKSRTDHYVIFEQWQDVDLPEPFCSSQTFRNDLYMIYRCTPTDIEKLFFNMSQGKFRFPGSAS